MLNGWAAIGNSKDNAAAGQDAGVEDLFDERIKLLYVGIAPIHDFLGRGRSEAARANIGDAVNSSFPVGADFLVIGFALEICGDPLQSLGIETAGNALGLVNDETEYSGERGSRDHASVGPGVNIKSAKAKM